MIQTYFATKISNTLKEILPNFYDKHAKQDKKLIETIEEKIAEQDEHFDKEDYTKFSSKLDDQDKKLSYFKTSYNERHEKISTNNKISTKIEREKTELEATMNMRID